METCVSWETEKSQKLRPPVPSSELDKSQVVTWILSLIFFSHPFRYKQYESTFLSNALQIRNSIALVECSHASTAFPCGKRSNSRKIRMYYCWQATVVENWSKYSEKTTFPVPLWSPQISRELARHRSTICSGKGRQLTAWAMARLLEARM
jgi:hypothetical protein